jgi:hypothetical protein
MKMYKSHAVFHVGCLHRGKPFEDLGGGVVAHSLAGWRVNQQECLKATILIASKGLSDCKRSNKMKSSSCFILFRCIGLECLRMICAATAPERRDP